MVYLLVAVNAASAIGVPLAALVFAIQSARLAHPARPRVRQVILGAIFGAVTVVVAILGVCVVWLPLALLKIGILGGVAAVPVFAGVVFAGYRFAARYAASEPKSKGL